MLYSGIFLFLSVLNFSLSLYFNIMDLSMMIEYNLFCIQSSLISMTLLFDWMSLLFMSFVLYISSMVIFYSKEYMAIDLNINRFIMLVCMFVLSMMFLIISPNLISILLGWDGLGLISYCLVIYYQNEKSFNAGMLTALSNRIGDVMILLAISWMLNYGSWNYIFYLEFMKNDSEFHMVSILIMIAAFTKSAQIPFSSWLPAAMAAPTPVSSLVHSSTLVTAGIYLLIRFSLGLNNNLLFLMMFLGVMTMFMAGLGANFEFDLKKIIALSTLSQLGLMMSILSLGDYNLTFFHLLTHALFKATLFMCAGSFIHNLNNCQDIRFLGGLIQSMPLTSSFFLISNMALCGIPFLSGFYSKDLMLEMLSMNYINMFMYVLFYLSTGLTVSYTSRLIYYSILGEFNFSGFHNLNDLGYFMLKSMMGLIFFVILGGSMLIWIMFPTPYFICLPFFMKMMTLCVIIMGGFLGFILSQFMLNYNSMTYMLKKLSFFSALMWNLPIISTLGVNFFPLFVGKYTFNNLDQGWFEFYGSQNLFFCLKNKSQFLQFIFFNNLKIYLLLLLFWMIFLFIIYLNSLFSA
uniref:NADH-ubiquinone oxidoreductase chain 5 n=1 Tax=Scaphisoma boleti TaxID=1588438 RepID=A0A0S2M891_9COLE|nr:NADH deshydrogenase subunit 5 [Scaphisoma boleti]